MYSDPLLIRQETTHVAASSVDKVELGGNVCLRRPGLSMEWLGVIRTVKAIA